MNHQTRRSCVSYFAAITATLLSGLVSAQERNVTIGVGTSLTGSAAQYGKDMERGARLAVQEVNARKMVIGGTPVQFSLLVKDDMGDPRMAVQSAQSLIDAKVAGVVGHLLSGCTIPASGVYEKAGMQMIVPTSSNPIVTKQGYKNVFRIYGNDEKVAKQAAAYAINVLKAKSIAVIDDRTAFGQNLADAFEVAVKAGGGTMAAHEFTTDQAMDFRAIVTNVRNAKADLVFFAGLAGQGSTFVKQARQMGYRGTLMAGATFANKEFIERAGPAADGMLAYEQGVPLATLPDGKDFMARFRKVFNSDVVAYAQFGYDGVYTLINAMNAADSTDPKVYGQKIGSLSFQGLTGQIAFDSTGDIKVAKNTLYEVKNGAWVALGTK